MSILEGFTAITFKGGLTFNSNKPRILSVALRYGENVFFPVQSAVLSKALWTIRPHSPADSVVFRKFLSF